MIYPGITDLSLANTRSRLRMTMLYQIASTNSGIVVGTGNKVEDFGVGFFTKYGDGGVDISPIADLMKSEVRDICTALDVSEKIIEAPPTDGLWDDGRTDEDQIGLSYNQLEWAMKNFGSSRSFTTEEQSIIDRYLEIRGPNLHKMNPIPICKVKDILGES
jgi:NAD+ synthase